MHTPTHTPTLTCAHTLFYLYFNVAQFYCRSYSENKLNIVIQRLIRLLYIISDIFISYQISLYLIRYLYILSDIFISIRVSDRYLSILIESVQIIYGFFVSCRPSFHFSPPFLLPLGLRVHICLPYLHPTPPRHTSTFI